MAKVIEDVKKAMEALTGAGRTRSGRRYGLASVSRKVRKQRSNKGVKRGPRMEKQDQEEDLEVLYQYQTTEL